MKKIILALFSCLILSSVFAHEYVMLAYQFVVKKGDTLEIHLFVADGFNIELERPMQSEITKSFNLISENGKINLLSEIKNGVLPILKRTVNFKGLGLISMQRDYAEITMNNEKFKSYLIEDNIENVTINEVDKTEQKERYTRYLKSLVQSNPLQNDSIYKTVVGHKFEIVLLENPYLKNEGDWLSAKILFNNIPLQNKIITARNRNGNKSATVQYSRTNMDGICEFKLDRTGDWFLHATHMIASEDKKAADWESFWTTFSFGLPE